MNNFIERKLRLLDGRSHQNSIPSDQESDCFSLNDNWRTNFEKISVNPILIDKIRIPKTVSNTFLVPTSDATVVCQKTLVDRIVIKNLAYNLSKSIPFDESSRRCSTSTGRGRFSQTAERLRNSLATQALNDRTSRDGHCYDSHLVCRLAEALSSPATTTAQQLAVDESHRPRASQTSSSANSIRIEAVASLMASREALSDFNRLLPTLP
jgi:hypothetical protein